MKEILRKFALIILLAIIGWFIFKRLGYFDKDLPSITETKTIEYSECVQIPFNSDTIIYIDIYPGQWASYIDSLPDSAIVDIYFDGMKGWVDINLDGKNDSPFRGYFNIFGESDRRRELTVQIKGVYNKPYIFYYIHNQP